MDLKTFVKSALIDIRSGVADAQKEDGGENINAEAIGITGGNLIDSGSYGVFTRVDFDVAVSAETEGKGKAGLVVFGVGAEGGVNHKTGTVSRLTFSVPVRLPDGDRTRVARVNADANAETEFNVLD